MYGQGNRTGQKQLGAPAFFWPGNSAAESWKLTSTAPPLKIDGNPGPLSVGGVESRWRAAKKRRFGVIRCPLAGKRDWKAALGGRGNRRFAGSRHDELRKAAWKALFSGVPAPKSLRRPSSWRGQYLLSDQVAAYAACPRATKHPLPPKRFATAN